MKMKRKKLIILTYIFVGLLLWGSEIKLKTIPFPSSIKDSVTISIKSPEPEDGIVVAESEGIPIDWGIYATYPYIGGNFEVTLEKVNSVHNMGKLYIQYIACGNVYLDGHTLLGDIRPDLLNYAILDIDGNKYPFMFDSPTVYKMNMNEEGWQEFLKSEIKLAIEAGADGIFLDEIQGQTLNIGYDGAGVFNEPDMVGFKEFLIEVYSQEELFAKFGIADINSFNYRDYIINNGFKNQWKNAPNSVPLYNEFKVFEYKSTINVLKNLIQWAKDYAQTNYGKYIVFLGNTSDGLSLSLPFEDPIDLSWLEFPYLDYGYPPLCKVIPASKVNVDERWKKGTYLTNVPTNIDLVERNNPPNISKVFIAEAYASKCEYQVPYKVVTSTTEGYSPDLSVLAPYYQFIDRNRNFFGKDWTWKSKVAIFYPNSYFLGTADEYFGAALALFDAGIQFDVIFSGDNRIIKNKVTLSDLFSYPVIILANTVAMTAQQVQLITDYINLGGTVIGWGIPGGANEFNDWSIQRPYEWTNFWEEGLHYFGDGVFINLSSSHLGEDYFRNRSISVINKIMDAIAPTATPEVSSTAPSNVNFLLYSNSLNDKIALHILNYNYSIENDSIAPIINFSVTFRLPDGFNISEKRAILLSPDFLEAMPLNYSVQGDFINLIIPILNYYDILVMGDCLTLALDSGNGGTVNPSSGTYIYDAGTEVTITAIPENGYRFSEWSGDASGTDNPIKITMDSDKSVKANFRRQYTLTIASGQGGTTDLFWNYADLKSLDPWGDGDSDARDAVAVYVKEQTDDLHFRLDLLDLGVDTSADLYFAIDYKAGGNTALISGNPTFASDIEWDLLVKLDDPSQQNVWDTSYTDHPSYFNQSSYQQALDYVEFSIAKSALSGWTGGPFDLQVIVAAQGQTQIADKTAVTATTASTGRAKLVLVMANMFIAYGPHGISWYDGFSLDAARQPGERRGTRYFLDAVENYGIPITTIDLQLDKLPGLEYLHINHRLRELAQHGVLEIADTLSYGYFMPCQPQDVDSQAIAKTKQARQDLELPLSDVFYPYEGMLTYGDLATIKDAGYPALFAVGRYGYWLGDWITDWSDPTAVKARIEQAKKVHRINGINTLFDPSMHYFGFAWDQRWGTLDYPTRYQMFEGTDGGLHLWWRRILHDLAIDTDQEKYFAISSDFVLTPLMFADVSERFARWLAEHPWIEVINFSDLLAKGWPPVDHGDLGLAPGAPMDRYQLTNDGHYNAYFWQFYYGGTADGHSPFVNAGDQIEAYADYVPYLREGQSIPSGRSMGDEQTVDTIVYETLSNLRNAPDNRLSQLAWFSYYVSIEEQILHSQTDYPGGQQPVFDIGGKYLHPLAMLRANYLGHVNKIVAAAHWADDVEKGLQSATSQALSQDLDLDGEDEYILKNDKLFAIFENDGARLEYGFAYDPAVGAVQLVAPLNQHYDVICPSYDDCNYENGESGLRMYWPSAAFIDDDDPYRLFNADPIAPGDNCLTFRSQDGQLVKGFTLQGNHISAHYNSSGPRTVGFGLPVQMASMYTRDWDQQLEKIDRAGQKGWSVSSGGFALVNPMDTNVVSMDSYADSPAQQEMQQREDTSSYPVGHYLFFPYNTLKVNGSGEFDVSLALAAGEYSASTDLKVTKDDTPDPVNAGENITYTITVTNDGPGDASGVTLQDILPAGVIFVSAAPTQGSCSEVGGVVTCDLGNLGVGGTASVDIEVTAPDSAGDISNQASVTGNESDPDNANNSANEVTTVNALVDLEVNKNDTPDPVNAGASLSYSVTVTNHGPSDATGVTVTDTLPVGCTFNSATPTQGSCSEASGVVTGSLGSLAAGGSAQVSILVTAPSSAGDINNQVSIAGNETDPDNSNNAASVATTVRTPSGDGGNGGGGCFIATAAYGSYLDPDVGVLCDFRDRYLLTNTPGKAFVAFYYKVSPPIADYIRDHEAARTATRWALTPLVYCIQHPWLSLMLVGGIALTFRQKKAYSATLRDWLKIEPTGVFYGQGMTKNRNLF